MTAPHADSAETRAGLGDALWLAALLALLVAASLPRQLMPIDETRYASVAWEMWTRSDFLVPHLNGAPYHHKPPLLFWLLHAGWALLGVNEWWPRLISPLFAAGTLALTVVLGRQLWPRLPAVARMAPFIVLASFLFSYFATALMFDAMLSFFVVLGYVGLVRAWQTGGGRSGFLLLALALAGALFSKGPVALLHLLPAALLAPWWMRERRPPWGRWYAGVVVSCLVGGASILAWAVPAGIAGGSEYQKAIFWGQTAHRMVRSFAHQAPWWMYLAWLPVMLTPWLLWPRWWLGLRRALLGESGFRLVLLGGLSCLLLFSMISGKRPHYLLPEFVLFALLASRALAGSVGGRWSLAVPAISLFGLGVAAAFAAGRMSSQLGIDSPMAMRWAGALYAGSGLGLLVCRPAAAWIDVRRVCTATVVAMAGIMFAFDIAMREPYDLSVMGGKLSQAEREGRPLAVEGDYHGQWTLAGRLQRPLVEVAESDIADWLASNPRGRVVLIYRDRAEIPTALRVVHAQRYRGAWVALLALD